MNLFSPEQVSQLRAEFPGANITDTLQRIEARAADEPIRHPMSFARAWLKREADEAPAATPARAHRGTLRPDGSWWADADHASATERAITELCTVISRNHVSPRDAVPMIQASAILAGCVPSWDLESMARFDGQPRDCEHGPHPDLAWVAAAWACCPSYTSAQRMVKSTLLSRWDKILRAAYYPAEAEAERIAAATYAGKDEYPDNGSAW